MSETKKHASGRNIYVDDKGRDIYYDRFTKAGYVLQEKNLKNYTSYQNRYLLVIVGVILVSNFLTNVPMLYCILGGLAIAIFLEIRFRVSFLPSLVKIEGFKPVNKQTNYSSITSTEEKNKVILKTILYLLLAILIVANAIIEKLNPVLFGLSIVVAIVACYAFAINLKVLLKNLSNK